MCNEDFVITRVKIFKNFLKIMHSRLLHFAIFCQIFEKKNTAKNSTEPENAP